MNAEATCVRMIHAPVPTTPYKYGDIANRVLPSVLLKMKAVIFRIQL